MMTLLRLDRRQVRSAQRLAHLVAGAGLLGYVYLAPHLNDGMVALVQWVLVPIAVGSGIALWKWPRIRATLTRREARP